MFSFNADKIENNICKNHSARSERESCRVSPTKLSRQKLEDLYFSLLDSNMELKQTVNSQNEKIKVMSTKILRLMETRKIVSSKDQKQCCAAATAVVIEQKNENEDLRHKNMILSERIRILNTRLCSAKQFMKTSPQSVYNKAGRCRTAPIHSVKISSSTNILSVKNNDGNLHSLNERIENEANSRNVSTRTVETEISEKEILQLCDENRCKVVKEELEQRIVLLQEKIDEMEMENANKVSQLRSEMEKLQLGCADAERCIRDAETLATQYRDATTRCDELSLQLSIERKKVVELETELKLMQKMSEQRTIFEPNESTYLQSPLKDSNVSRYSNDSGYTDEKSPGVTKSVIENEKQFLEKMAELQNELDTLKSSIDNELMNKNRGPLDLKIKNILNSDDCNKVKYSKESFEINNDEANVEIADTNNTLVVDIVKAETDDIAKSTTANKSNDNTINGAHKTSVEISKVNVIRDEESENNVELDNTNRNKNNTIVNKLNKPALLSQPSNDKINNTKNTKQKRVKNIKKVIKSKSVDDKNNNNNNGAKRNIKRASVDFPLVFNVTNVKPQSVAMEVKFEYELEVAEDKEFEFDGDIDGKDDRPLSARTYTVSPDTTRQELSALSDLPLERDVCRLMSPGEVNDASQSVSASSSTVEFGSLSEGELSGGTRLSLGEREVVNGGTHTSRVHQESTSQRVASTMREVCEQMSRCKRLIAAARNSNL